MEKLQDPGNLRQSWTGFHTVDFGFHGLDLRIPCQWNLDHWWNSTLQIPSSIPDSPTNKNFPKSGFPLSPLHEAKAGESLVTKTNFIFLTSIFFHRAGSITGLLLLIALAFGIFICCLRRKLPDGVPKPPVCTTVKVNHWKYTQQMF